MHYRWVECNGKRIFDVVLQLFRLDFSYSEKKVDYTRQIDETGKNKAKTSRKAVDGCCR